jgi:hypothetical protein
MGTGIEIVMIGRWTVQISSLPSWVRGLKFISRSCCKPGWCVALFVGVWVEILKIQLVTIKIRRILLGAWIETIIAVRLLLSV